MNTKIKILIAEHDPVDVELLHYELKTSGLNYVSEVVQNEKEYVEALNRFVPDIILCDYSFPSFDGTAAFKIKEKMAFHTPFIFVSGTIGEENAVALIKSGVTDYVLKDKLFTLSFKVNRALKSEAERKQKNKTEQELIKSERKYRQIVETAQEGIWLIDENNYTTLVNKKMADILECTEEEIMGKQHFTFMDDEWKAKASGHIESRKLGSSENHDFKYITKTGKEVWTNISTNPVFDDAGTYKGALAMVTDISQKIKSAHQLITQEKRYRALVENGADAVVIMAAEGKLLYASPTVENILGYTEEEIMKLDVFAIIHPDDMPGIAKVWEQVLANPGVKIPGYTSRMLHKNGSRRWLEATVTNMLHDPTLNGIVDNFRDITERRNTEIRMIELNRDLLKQSKDLAISNTELEQFAYVASHDLQEPLRMVTGFLTQLEKKYGNLIDEKGKKYIAFAVDGAKRMRQIILDLLEYSRIGRIEDKIENIDLNELVCEIEILLRNKIKEKKAIIIVYKLPGVLAHRSPIHQIFQNLLSNALKYSKKDIPSQISIAVEELKDHWQFSVRDNGIGIDEEYFDKIFIIFQRLHNKDDFSGTGMGLSVTKKIVESLGGKIWVTSEEEKGSCFYFTIKK